MNYLQNYTSLQQLKALRRKPLIYPKGITMPPISPQDLNDTKAYLETIYKSRVYIPFTFNLILKEFIYNRQTCPVCGGILKMDIKSNKKICMRCSHSEPLF